MCFIFVTETSASTSLFIPGAFPLLATHTQSCLTLYKGLTWYTGTGQGEKDLRSS